MASRQSKASENGNDARAVVSVDDPARIRNVVLVGPSGGGKTTLIEALLAHTGTIPRAGAVVDGTTVCDHDASAIRQQRSVELSVAPILFEGNKINLIDTPGYVDFVGEVRAGLRAADAALFVIGASDGVDPASTMLWAECAEVGMPMAVAIARTDHVRADVPGELAACRVAFGDSVLPLYLPAGEDLVGLLTKSRQDGTPYEGADINDARAELIEGIIAESEDETLMDRYLAGDEIGEDVLITDLEKAVAAGTFHPALPVCADTGLGLDPLLRVLSRGFPTPLEHPIPGVSTVDGTRHDSLMPDPHGTLAAEVVRTTMDSYVGRVSLVRVFSGTLRAEDQVHVCGHGLAERGHPDHDADERVAHLYSPLGAQLREVSYCVAGDICALTKVGSAETGDTVSATADPLLMPPWPIPRPLLPLAITAHSRSDEDVLARNLSRLAAGDPTLRLERNADTHQLVLWCMGEAHADVVLERLRAGGAEVDTEEVRVPLRATFTAPAHGRGRHVKQSGGHGQYAVCEIEVTPLPRGSGVEFVDKVVGGAVPHQFIPSVEKGVRAQLAAGLGDDRPVLDVRVTLLDGKAHSVDSSDSAFQTAGALAIKDAATTAGTICLEPLDLVTVHVPDDHLGAILGDLSTRRGRVLGTQPAEAAASVVTAEVPASQLGRYPIDIRSLTSGTASFTREFSRYEPVTEPVASPSTSPK
jgi:elongation factor G